MSDDFDDARRQKWLMGRSERGLSKADPFDGDWAAEAQYECLDLPNYCEVGMMKGELSEQEWVRLYDLSREFYFMLDRVIRDRRQA